MSKYIREYGIRLLIAKIKFYGSPLELVKHTPKWNIIEEVGSGIKIVKDVLWMRLLEASGNKIFSNGCRFFFYEPFWKETFPKGKRYYRFRTNNGVPNLEIPGLQNLKSWSYHSF